MELIQTSKDVMNIAISFSILLISVFIAWFIFYMAMIMKQFYDIIHGVKGSMKKVDDAIDAFKEKIEHSASYLLLIGEGIKKLVEVAKNFSDGKKNKEDEDDEETAKKKAKKDNK